MQCSSTRLRTYQDLPAKPGPFSPFLGGLGLPKSGPGPRASSSAPPHPASLPPGTSLLQEVVYLVSQGPTLMVEAVDIVSSSRSWNTPVTRPGHHQSAFPGRHSPLGPLEAFCVVAPEGSWGPFGWKESSRLLGPQWRQGETAA